MKYILDHLPETLEGTYDQILSRIPLADASDAAKLLLWLAFTEQPLCIDNLAIIVEFDMDSTTFVPAAKLASPNDVLQICSSLVVEMGDNTLQLAHASVKQYLLEKPRIIHSSTVIDPSIGNRFVGQCCLAYLLYLKETHPIVKAHKPSQSMYEQYLCSLGRYSANHWPEHILEVHQDEAIIEQMKELFVLNSFSFKNWVDLFNYELHFLSDTMKKSSLLHCAAFHGLTTMVEWLLQGVVRDEEVMEALVPASRGGHTSTVIALLATCKSFHAHHLQACSSLHAACFGGFKMIAELLLDRGVSITTKGIIHSNALQAASAGGHKEIIQLLIEKGADVNAQGNSFGSALKIASTGCGQKEVIELLLDRGADINAQGGSDRNDVLQCASLRGQKDIVTLLLDRGANVNAEGGRYGSALQAASVGGHREIIELLLEKGANVNAEPGGEYGNALQAALARDHKDNDI